MRESIDILLYDIKYFFKNLFYFKFKYRKNLRFYNQDCNGKLHFIGYIDKFHKNTFDIVKETIKLSSYKKLGRRK